MELNGISCPVDYHAVQAVAASLSPTSTPSLPSPLLSHCPPVPATSIPLCRLCFWPPFLVDHKKHVEWLRLCLCCVSALHQVPDCSLLLTLPATYLHSLYETETTTTILATTTTATIDLICVRKLQNEKKSCVSFAVGFRRFYLVYFWYSFFFGIFF